PQTYPLSLHDALPIFHCHLLPEVDDGPKSWDIAVEMCRMAAADGITHAVATPHANDRYAYDRAYLSALLGQLREKIEVRIEEKKDRKSTRLNSSHLVI